MRFNILTTVALGMLTVAGTLPAMAAQTQVDGYRVSDLGYVTSMHRTNAGLVTTTNAGNEIALVDDNGAQRTLVTSRGAGMFINVSPDGRTVGFKSIDNNWRQAPALLDVATGAVKLLEPYSQQCGQVSFANDGTMAYTVGETLYVRHPDGLRAEFKMPFYQNIVNISPDGKTAAFGSIDGDFYTIDLTNGAIAKHGEYSGAYNPVWSPDGTKIAVQTVHGKLFTVAAATPERRYDLGDVTTFSWADNDQIVLTRDEHPADMQLSGASVVRVRFDGTDAVKLVDNAPALPRAVMAEADGSLTIAYATGDARGLRRVKGALKAARLGAPAMQQAVLAINPDEHLRHLGEKTDLRAPVQAENQKPGMRKGNDIGLTAIPYINQVWDTPSNYSGNYSWGYVCCAPSSCCMNLGYHKLLDPHGVASRASGVGTVYYSWYVGRDYTSKQGFTFNTRANYDGSVGGGYGYMWGNGSPATMMDWFYYYNSGLQSEFESSWACLQRECNANRPYTICLQNGTGGHVVLGFLHDKAAAGDGSSTWASSGSFVCHDPYGDYNATNYPNWDGRYSTYDWPGINNGHANIGVFYWGCWAYMPEGSTPTPSNPSISFSPNPVNFTCKVNEHPTATVSVTGKDLSSDIAVASFTPGRFSTSVSSLPAAGGSFTITFNISDKVGTYGPSGTAVDADFYIKLKSGSTEVKVPVRATVTENPSIEFSPSTVNFNCKLNEHPTAEVTVTGKGLTDKISVGSITPGRFSTSVTELPATGGKFTITFANSDKAGTYGTGGTAQDYNFFVRLKSGNLANVTVPITATVTDDGSGTQDPDPVDPQPQEPTVTYKDQIEGMDEGWIFSTNKGNLASGASWFTADASANMARSLAVIGENLYVANDKAWGSAPGIVIVDAKTGAKKGDLSVDGITGGTTKISSLKAMGTTLLASNFATATQPLKVYKWTNGAGAPTCILETTAHGIPAGEHMGVSGTMDNGRIAFSDGNKVVWFAVKNGAVDANPNVITLAESAGGNRSADQVTFNADGTFWLVNKDITPTLYTAAGAKKEAIPADAVGKVYGTSAAYFNYGTHKYVAAVTTLGGTTSAAWSNGAAALVDVTNGAAAGTRVGIYPSNGLGETAWGGTAGVTDICHRLSDTNNSQVDLYVLVPQQGIANYRFIGKSSAVTDIAVEAADADTPAEFYTLQGVRVPADNLTPGLYIRRQANRATKVLIK